jgi:hypothetical protein
MVRVMSSLDQSLSEAGLDLEDLRVAWREACNDVRCAYHAWRTAGPAGSGDWFAAYVAAADREAAAADVLARYTAGRLPADGAGFGDTTRSAAARARASALQADRRRCRRLS